MIIVDTSVWIDYFNGKDSHAVHILDSALGVETVAIGDCIAVEILQGFKEDKHYKTAKRLLDTLTTYEMLGNAAISQCTDNYRKLRKKWITIRKTIDVIIASFCIENCLPLLFSDKDFQPFVKYLGLIAVS